jgi:hypothetical protein
MASSPLNREAGERAPYGAWVVAAGRRWCVGGEGRLRRVLGHEEVAGDRFEVETGAKAHRDRLPTMEVD